MNERPRRILVVDDEESLRFTFESFLQDVGFQVTTAADFNEAVAALDQGPFDLIIADILIGERTGIDLLRRVRERGPTCPMIMITGFPNVDTAAEAVRLGAYDYIPKPVRQETLLRVVRMALAFRDLRAEKEAYQANLEAIFRSVKDGIVTVDSAFRVTQMNEAAQEICGYSEKAVGQDFRSLAQGCGQACLEALQKTLASGEETERFRLQCEQPGRPGQVVSLRVSPLRLAVPGDIGGAVLVVRDETRLNRLERDLEDRTHYHRLVGRSHAMQQLYFLLDRLAPVPTTVLITGESGTGKELVAEALHAQSPRRGKPLVKVNCAGLSESLLETELFGHVRGAFTGAVRDSTGRFQKADGGTIFLDEIGDISSQMQLRLLRVLQEKVIERVGDSRPIPVDVRVVAATNQNMAEKVRKGEFREDLFYRLKVVNLRLPSLRERRQDIPLLTEHFIEKLNRKLNRQVRGISDGAKTCLMRYDWPGNVRELEHVLEHAFILCPHDVLEEGHLPPELACTAPAGPKQETERAARGDEAQEIRAALDRTDWNKAKAARLLGMSRRTIYRKIEDYGLTRD